jgi:iron only hydrogenase large subunit-like protein
MTNSSAVYLSNVDDYLAPSQACVNPLYTDSNSSSNNDDEGKKKKKAANATTTASVVIPRRTQRGKISPSSNRAAIPTTTNNKNPIKASMADCLACSGCVTTAETVLLEQQHSLTALKAAMQQQQLHPDKYMVVATISPAVWADMLRHLGIPATSDDDDVVSNWKRKLVTSLQEILSVSAVLDGNVPLQWSLLELGDEFCQAYQAKKSQQQPANNSPLLSRQQLEENNTPSLAINCKETKFMLADGTTHVIQSTSDDDDVSSPPPPLPLLTSSCPALVCLVEKSTHNAVRHLSHTKSPMSLAGAWWRRLQEHQIIMQPGNKQIFHLALMPCHDKKLEASRKDFARPTTLVAGEQQQDVDIVLTTQEWFQFLVDYVISNRAIQAPNVDELSKEETIVLVKEYLKSLPLAPMMVPRLNISAMAGILSACPVTLLATCEEVNHDRTVFMEIDDDNKEVYDEMEIDIGVSNGIHDNRSNNNNENQTLPQNPSIFTMGSGGMAEFVFRYAAWRLFDTQLPKEIVWNPVAGGDKTQKGNLVVSARVRRAAVKNRDYYQTTLYRHDHDCDAGSYYSLQQEERGVPVLRFAIGYGLQTVQRILEPFQTNKQPQNGTIKDYPFDFVEAMACPSGCLNGGGQLRVADRETPTQNRQRIAATRELFASPSYTSTSMTTHMDELRATFSPHDRQTHFHVVPPLAHSLGAAAGVAVKDTQW